MKSLEEMSKSELLQQLFSANERLLNVIKDPSCSSEEKHGARVYLSTIVEEMGRRNQQRVNSDISRTRIDE